MKDIGIYLILGCAAGVLSGLIGIGGGIILIPALVYILGFSQHMAEGTTLAAMVPPIGILAAYVYYQNGNVDLKTAGFISVGFLLGGFLGARLAQNFSSETLQKIFAVILILVGVKMFWPKG
jgi:uncharacterized membrane protein YfcA